MHMTREGRPHPIFDLSPHFSIASLRTSFYRFGGNMSRKEEKRRKRMAEHPMETTLRTALWRQFGAAIDMLENALLACPGTLWNTHLWSDHSDPPQPSEFATFWSLTHHALFWLDLYLTGSLEGFAPPTPFT